MKTFLIVLLAGLTFFLATTPVGRGVGLIPLIVGAVVLYWLLSRFISRPL